MKGVEKWSSIKKSFDIPFFLVFGSCAIALKAFSTGQIKN